MGITFPSAKCFSCGRLCANKRVCLVMNQSRKFTWICTAFAHLIIGCVIRYPKTGNLRYRGTTGGLKDIKKLLASKLLAFSLSIAMYAYSYSKLCPLFLVQHPQPCNYRNIVGYHLYNKSIVMYLSSVLAFIQFCIYSILFIII